MKNKWELWLEVNEERMLKISKANFQRASACAECHGKPIHCMEGQHWKSELIINKSFAYEKQIQPDILKIKQEQIQ